MPSRSSMKTRGIDLMTVARVGAEQVTREKLNRSPLDNPHEGKNPHAVALGHMGGMKGGKARAAKLSPRRRKQIAKKAAAARWKARK